jgi:DNA-binding protein WhiA
VNYSEQIKEEILKTEPKKVCCSRALCCGIFAGAELSDEDGTIRFRTEQEGVAMLARRLLSERFGKETEIGIGSRPGHRIYTLAFPSKPLFKFLDALTDVHPDTVKEQCALFSFKCPECRAAFLRGLFLGTGSISDPEKAFHLEFRVPPTRADALISLFSEEEALPNCVTRRDKIGLYYKKSTLIADFFSLIGENGLYFSIADKQIEKQIRASENRLTNCEMKNLEKTVKASLAQIAAVKELFLSGEIERLPQELRETAVLRLEYDDDSLSSLAQRHVPPITKSGLNNRLRRIMETARDIRAERERKEKEEAQAEE